MKKQIKIKYTFFFLGILQMIPMYFLDGSKYLPIFGILATMSAILALFLPPLYPPKDYFN